MTSNVLTTKVWRQAVFLVVATLLSLAGCASGNGAASTGPTTTAPLDTLAPPSVANSRNVTIDALDNMFDPKHFEVRVGTKVTFVNVGHNPHDVVPDDRAAFDFGVAAADFQPGASKSFTFDKPGVYAYYCSIHSTATAGPMRGVITVTR